MYCYVIEYVSVVWSVIETDPRLQMCSGAQCPKSTQCNHQS